MNYESANPEPKRSTKKFWLGCFVVIGLFVTWEVSRPKKPVLQNVPVPPFVLPKGCDPNDVSDGEHAFKPMSPCFVEKYRIKDFEKFNFFRPGGRNPTSYYRFFDQAVALRCDPYKNRCQIAHIQHNVFAEEAKEGTAGQ